MNKILSLFLLSLAFFSDAKAGAYALTHNSRANCANNETISWHANHNYWFWIASVHTNGFKNLNHTVNQNWTLTWRGAAVHWGEGFSGGWFVEGHHWMKDNKGIMFQATSELVNDCSIYDGWWD